MYHPRRIHGSGPSNADIMVVGSRPGREEDKSGRVFAGKTGDELDRFLDGDALPARDDVFLTNLHREYRGKDYFYTADDTRTDEQDLLRELHTVRPSLLVPMGREATRWCLGDVDLDGTWGIPWVLPAGGKYTPRDKYTTVVFPVHHPASSFHNSDMAAYVVAGFAALAAYLDGKTAPRVLFDDPYPEPHYGEITSSTQLNAQLQRVGIIRALAIDTEGWPDRPWSVQFSYRHGEAFCIRAIYPAVLAAFGDYLHRVRPRLIYHSALHDIRMMRVLGLPTDLPFNDTMVMAYLLQLEPQGLKALCARHCGMKMQSYDDVLGNASQRLAIDYLSALWSIEQFDWEERCKDVFWQEIDKGRRVKVYPKLPKSALHKATERGLRSQKAHNLWDNQVEDVQVDGYNRLGPMPVPTLDHVERTTAVRYGCRDSDGTGRLHPALGSRIETMGLRDVYLLELSTYPLIERMSYVGIKPDLGYFRGLSRRLQTQLEALQDRLQHETNDSAFNANSGDQVAELLFEGLGLDSIKETRGGRGSTNDKILEALEHEHPEYPVITTIRTYRELYKLKNTFTDRLPDFVRRWPYDGRIHAAFRTTRVVTGRLAASDPNLLAMPKHGQFAREFRRGWVPEPGHIFCEWDLSQIELRVLAHLTQDPILLAAFRDGCDLHARLACRIFGGSESEHKHGPTRLAAKAINFGIPMGMTCKGLSVELRKNGVDVDEDDAQRWLDETMALYAQVPVYQDRMATEARTRGYVRCLSGRIRYIGGIRSPHRSVYEEARRFAFSTPIQEGAQWIMKMAESKVWDMLVSYWKDKRWIEPLIQIHDSLTIECEDDPALARDVNRQMVQRMTVQPPGFTVPIETSGEWGTNWCAYDEKAKYSPSTPGNGDMIPFQERT